MEGEQLSERKKGWEGEQRLWAKTTSLVVLYEARRLRSENETTRRRARSHWTRLLAPVARSSLTASQSETRIDDEVNNNTPGEVRRLTPSASWYEGNDASGFAGPG